MTDDAIRDWLANEDSDDSQRDEYIREACQEIQAEWSAKEELTHRLGPISQQCEPELIPSVAVTKESMGKPRFREFLTFMGRNGFCVD